MLNREVDRAITTTPPADPRYSYARVFYRPAGEYGVWTGAGQTVDGNQTELVVDGLTNGQAYNVMVVSVTRQNEFKHLEGDEIPVTGANAQGFTPGVVAVTADFNTDVSEGETPLTVQFNDYSTGIIDSWEWDFGDGSTSAQQNPSHIFNNPGDYNVTLTVTAGDLTSTASKVITVLPVSESVVAVTGITLNRDAMTLTRGKSTTLEALITPQNVTNQNIIWSSSDETVARVVDGQVTAVG